MPNFIVAYTLKSNTETDTFSDHYHVFKDEEFNGEAVISAINFYNYVRAKDGLQEGHHLWTISLAEITLSTDYN